MQNSLTLFDRGRGKCYAKEVDKGCPCATLLKGSPSKCIECPFYEIAGFSECITELDRNTKRSLERAIKSFIRAREVLCQK